MARNFQTGGPKAAAGTTGEGVSEREDLANFISMITRDETPFWSTLGSGKAKGILHEWQTDELSEPGSNAVAEGSDYDTVDAAQADEPYRTRLANYTQINSKTVKVTGTKRAVDQAGVADEYAYQLKKRGTELARDLEHDAVHSWNSSNGSGTRTFGGYQSFMNENVVSAGAAGSYTAPGTLGVGTAGTIDRGAADANLVELELSHVDDVMEAIYNEGGKATTLMTSPKNKRLFSAKAQAADSNVRRNIDERGSLRQSVELYESDFGLIKVVPNYIMGKDANVTTGDATTNAANFTAIVYDPQWISKATLRPLHETDVGQRGDSTVGQIVCEEGLEFKNPKGSGMIVGIGA